MLRWLSRVSSEDKFRKLINKMQDKSAWNSVNNEGEQIEMARTYFKEVIGTERVR